ncbi:hypothetical protein FGO68_gene1806 [Halteria grandinella]|uniref:Protein kinase domain-containing protein n=1 Tax=Halteria grandinella TaxID=5974 RepID=A0A8J8T2E8_HALGN|nr:hypothetical protein FGO68_gene1806 [Halteria grandinella]
MKREKSVTRKRVRAANPEEQAACKRVKFEKDEEFQPLVKEEQLSAPSSKHKRSKSSSRAKENYPYQYGKIISTGMIGVVYLARRFEPDIHCHSFYCIKLMSYKKIQDKNIFPSVEREIKILALLNGVQGCMQLIDIHPFNDLELEGPQTSKLKCEEGSDVRPDQGIKLIFPYYPKGDLYKSASVKPERPLDQLFVKHIARQLIQALINLHALNIIHRDLKPENIIVTSPKGWDVVLTDFGFAISKQELQRENKYTRVGTLEFYPIEMLSPCLHPHRIIYDERVDIWSLGVVLYELLYGQTPFFTGDEAKTKLLIRQIKYTFPHPGKFPEAEEFFAQIFVLPQERITLEEMLEHEWLAE